eukprot:Skav224482  [mRNA]  locus=scaffold1302:832519:833872:- [translate_table: standard]
MQDLSSHLATLYRQTVDCKSFSFAPIPVSDQAARPWSQFKRQAEADKHFVPPCASGAVGKHCFTTTSHILACHLLQEAFLGIKTGRVDLAKLRTPTPEALEPASALQWPQPIRPLQADLVRSVQGRKYSDEQRLRPRRRQAKQEPAEPDAPSNEEKALGVLVRRFPEVTVTMVNESFPRGLGFRSDQVGIRQVFDLAAEHQAGVQEGSLNASVRLRLTLSQMDVGFRRRLNLRLSELPRNNQRFSVAAVAGNPFLIGAASPSRLPPMAGAGKRACKEPQEVRQNADRRHAHKVAEEKKLERKPLVDPVHVPANPLRAQAVEDATAAALQNQAERVHGKPFRVNVARSGGRKAMPSSCVATCASMGHAAGVVLQNSSRGNSWLSLHNTLPRANMADPDKPKPILGAKDGLETELSVSLKPCSTKAA